MKIGTIMKMFCIYEKPLDFPEHFVVRGYSISEGGKLTPDEEPFMVEKQLEKIHAHLKKTGLFFVVRSEEDDGKIIGTYI